MAVALLAAADLVRREAALFAGTGFLILGAADVMIDLIWAAIAARKWRQTRRETYVCPLEALPAPCRPGMLAIFIPAWDEAGVLGAMLRNTIATYGSGDYRLYVGCYRNDPSTIAEVQEVLDPRIRLVTLAGAGPTTKADCLNHLWRQLLRDEAADGKIIKAVILHDAEDVVHPAELRLFDTMIETYDLVQLPVVPLIHPASRWVSGHYADEFAEAHAKELVVRQWLGAAIPSAGVGCALSRAGLAKLAERGDGMPFDTASLTEDYELGLKLRALGGSQAFVRIAEARGGKRVATYEYFPATVSAAVRQKARWMTGIALSGWDRLGWAGGIAERWMRLRDRQSILAAVLLFAAYLALVLHLLLEACQWVSGWQPESISPGLGLLLKVNLAILAWRLSLRFGFVSNLYGWRQGLLSIPRVTVANFISILAAWQAVAAYRGAARGVNMVWKKTAHSFPAQPAAK